MQYTLKDVKDALVAQTQAYGFGDDAGCVLAINRAIRAMSTMSGWKKLRRTCRFVTDRPAFALPQGCAGLVRVCVNGRPASVRGTEFSFIQSGIGDPPPGYREIPVRNVVDAGFAPVSYECPSPAVYVAFAASASSLPEGLSLVLSAVGNDGSGFEHELPVNRVESFASATDLRNSDQWDGYAKSPQAVMLNSVVIKGESPSDIRLYAEAGGNLTPAAVYRRSVAVPTFHWYRIPGARPGRPIGVLAETRVDPLPLVSDTDVVPFDAIEPIEWMIRAEWESRSGEVDRAEKYRQMADAWLLRQEQTDETAQTPVIVNSLFDGSPGEISEDSWNI